MKTVLWGVVSVLYLLSPALTEDYGQNLDESLERSGQPNLIADTINSDYSPYFEPNFANSNAQAGASSNAPINFPTLSSSSPLLNSALTNSKAFSESGAYAPYNQPFNGPGENLINLGTGANSHSSAQVLANTLSGVPSEPQLLYLGQSNDQIQPNAQASAQAASLAQALSHSHPHIQPFSEAEAQALTNAQGATGYNTGSLSGLLPSRQLYDQAMTSANAQAVANTGSRAFWRPIPSHEYIRPHQFTDGPDIKCTFEGELHHVWTVDYDCMVCVCLQDFSTVCASCSGCSKPLPYLPPQPPPVIVDPIQPVPPLPPLPPPKSVVTCSPLPSNQAFQNPLNPCQICICKEIIDAFGNPDVKIECEENPQCVLPPEPLPPLRELHTPIPLPICDKFPVDVSFPHPTDSCLICKCIVIPVSLTLVKHFTCSPNPTCEPQIINSTPLPQPIPIPTVPEAIAVPIPEPISIPELNPLPIPTPQPIAIPKPLPPSPLVGPSPHESCRPFTPRQPFQHPWDECQVCICSESITYQRITIEINCFTKPDCCIEYAQPQTQPQSLPLYISGGSSNAESYAHILPSVTPGKVLVETDANAAANSGFNLYQPNQPGFLPSPKTYLPGLSMQGSNSFAEADASASATGINQIQPVLPTTRPNHPVVVLPSRGYYPSFPTLLPGKGSTHTLATADAGPYASNVYGPGNTGYHPDLHRGLSNAQALAESGNFNYGYKAPGYMRFNLGNIQKPTPGYFSGLNSAQSIAEAESSASVNSGSNLPIYYPGHSEYETLPSIYPAYNKPTLPGYIPATVTGTSSDVTAAANTGHTTLNYLGGLTGQYNPQTVAGSEANTVTHSGFTSVNYPGYYSMPGYNDGQMLTDAETSAAASAVSNAGYIKSNNAGYYPITSQGQTGSLAKAEAEANAFANAGYNKGNQAVYPTVVPTIHTQGLLTDQPLSIGLSTASADAKSFASGQGSTLGSADANAFSSNTYGNPLNFEAQASSQANAMATASSIKSGQKCKYEGDLYHEACQACYCHQDSSGDLYSICLGTPCD